MNKAYIQSQDKFSSDKGAVTLSVAALFMTENTEKAFLACCSNISFKRLNTATCELSLINKNYYRNDLVDVLILEIDMNAKEDLQKLKSLLETKFSEIPVIVTTKDVTLSAARELMHMGVVDVLPQPFVESDILTVLRRANEKNVVPHGKDSNGKVISFIKGGGGVGATTLAVQAGCILSSKLAEHNMDVSLLDLDIQFGTAALYLDIQCDDGLMAILGAGNRIDGTLMHGALNKHETSGLKILTVPRQVMPMDIISEDTILQALDLLRYKHKFTIIDLPGAWTPWSATVLENSDMIVLVTEISIAAISKAKRQLDTLIGQGLSDIPIKVVVNRYTDKTEKVFSLKDVEKVLGRPIDYKIPNNYKLVCDAENKGVSIMNVGARTELAKSIKKLITDLAEELADEEMMDYLADQPGSFLERLGMGHVFTK